MKRDLIRMAGEKYDVLVLGGGIYGACVAWEAVLRGLSVALVDKADFGSATSANSLKIIHGGLRYLQHADLQRARESMRERRTLMRIAPHLVHPLPVLIPTYGHGTRGKGLFALALGVNDLIGYDRNRLDDPEKHIPAGQVISRQECLALLPGIREHGLTGAALFYDAQVYNSERLVLSFLQSAWTAGARLANYVEAVGFLLDGHRVLGVRAKDTLTGAQFDIRAQIVVNACGPWVHRLLGLLCGRAAPPSVGLAKAVNLVTRPLFPECAVGIPARNGYRDPDALIDRGSRLLFITPWRGRSLIGTAYSVFGRDPADFSPSERDTQHLLDEINAAYPGAALKRAEVCYVHGGLLPMAGLHPGGHEVCLAKHYRIYDHRREGLSGLITVIGVKYTTARHVAEKVIDRVFQLWGHKPPKSLSSATPLHDGQIGGFETYLQEWIRKRPHDLDEETIRTLVLNYGSAFPAVLQHIGRATARHQLLSDHLVALSAQTRYAIREEMAQKLADVVFRRTELGTAGHPGDGALRFCAGVMAAELTWNCARVERELQEVGAAFPQP